MAQIGTFTAAEDGSFSGTIRTLTLNVKVAIQPTGTDQEKAPDYRVFASGGEIGAGWKKTSRVEREYISLKLDDPTFPAPIYASLLDGEDGKKRLIWSR